MGLISEYIKRRMSTNDLEQELLRLIKEYNRYRKTFLIVVSASVGKPIPNIALTMDDYYMIFDFLKNISSNSLDFYIETPGGSGEAAEEIVEFIHKKFEDVAFVVSGEAKSAGTIMVLSGDDILMTESGSLGPIDAQIRIGRSVISAFDYMEWVDERREEAEKNKKLNPFDATMIAQISPGELGGTDNALNFAVDLVEEWLPKYKFKNWNITETTNKPVTDEMKVKRAKEIVKDLINHKKWRTHGRSLKIHDLEAIGLKIKTVDDDTKLADLVYRIQIVIKLLYNTSNIYKVFATENDKIFAFAAPAGIPPPAIQPKDAEVVNIDIPCPKCSRIHKLYAKFKSDPKIDDDFKKKGFIKLPLDNKLKCSCGFEIDISGVRNQIETQIGKKILD